MSNEFGLDDTPAEPAMPEGSYCNGICVTAADVGIFIPGNPVAYPHPGCPEHGTADYCEHCEGWGSIAGDALNNAQTCPMCDGGVKTDS